MTNVEQLICEMFIFDNYSIIFMHRKSNDVFFAYLIFNFKILNAKIIENEIALFQFIEKIKINNYLIYLISYLCFIDYDVNCVVRVNIITQDRFAL
jgi:hypothetical protein